MPNRDSVDSAFLAVLATPNNDPFGYAYAAGTPATLAAGTPCADSDGDGIPDAYETQKCGSATCLNAQAVQSDGFTNLDAWVARFVRLFSASIYKWVQAPTSLHVGNLDLERERALQLPVVQRGEWQEPRG